MDKWRTVRIAIGILLIIGACFPAVFGLQMIIHLILRNLGLAYSALLALTLLGIAAGLGLTGYNTLKVLWRKETRRIRKKESIVDKLSVNSSSGDD